MNRSSQSLNIAGDVVVLVVIVLSALLASCTSKPELRAVTQTDSVAILTANIQYRAEVDSFFRYDSGSPFQRDTTIAYHGIRWFPINVHFKVASILHRYAQAETVAVTGTKGETRRELKYGYFEFVLPDEHGLPLNLKLNVYKFTEYDGDRYTLYKNTLSAWFRDRTTGQETYGVGRYVNVGMEDTDPGHVYEIDFNRSYNPYCAYSALYSCAVPRKEDYLDLALHVGEMNYHE
jgi:uncharacterized protein (DUF1684 family)